MEVDLANNTSAQSSRYVVLQIFAKFVTVIIAFLTCQTVHVFI